jgi:hypothetical protein
VDNAWAAWQHWRMVTFATAKTAAELRDASVLRLCYGDEAIEEFIVHRDRCGLLDALLALSGYDACWALASWLPKDLRVEWAHASARRAKEYADSVGAAASAYAACAAARASARASARAHDARAAARARRKEFATAVRHGVLLLTGEV